jgi:hypothetical protein
VRCFLVLVLDAELLLVVVVEGVLVDVCAGELDAARALPLLSVLLVIDAVPVLVALASPDFGFLLFFVEVLLELVVPDRYEASLWTTAFSPKIADTNRKLRIVIACFRIRTDSPHLSPNAKPQQYPCRSGLWQAFHALRLVSGSDRDVPVPNEKAARRRPDLLHSNSTSWPLLPVV